MVNHVSWSVCFGPAMLVNHAELLVNNQIGTGKDLLELQDVFNLRYRYDHQRWCIFWLLAAHLLYTEIVRSSMCENVDICMVIGTPDLDHCREALFRRTTTLKLSEGCARHKNDHRRRRKTHGEISGFLVVGKSVKTGDFWISVFCNHGFHWNFMDF